MAAHTHQDAELFYRFQKQLLMANQMHAEFFQVPIRYMKQLLPS